MRRAAQIGLIAPLLCALLSLSLAWVTLKQATRYASSEAQRWLAQELSERPLPLPAALMSQTRALQLELKVLAHQGGLSEPSYLDPLSGWPLSSSGATSAPVSQVEKAWYDARWSPKDQWTQGEERWFKRPLKADELSAIGLSAPLSQPTLIARLGPLERPPIPWGLLLISTTLTLCAVIGLRRWAHERREGGLLIGLIGSACYAWPLLAPLSAAQRSAEGWAQALNCSAPELLPGALLAPLCVALPWLGLAIAHLFTRGRPSPHRVAYTYMAPTLLSVGLLVFVPFALGVALAFTRVEHGQFEWVGLAHFYHILGGGIYELSHPLNFYFTLGVTLLWTALNVVLHTSLGLSLALLLNREGLALKGLYRALLIIPWAIPNYITALIWKGMFHQQYGLINHSLELLGLEAVPWMSTFWGSMAANVTTNTWLGFPFMMVVSLGALQSVPRDLYEAAELAGASAWERFRHITLPLLIPALTPAIILGSVWTFNMFNIIYLVSGGQPGGATDILITEAYRWAFEQDRYGYAAAYSLVIFVILILYARLTQRLSKAAEEVYS